MSTGTFLPLLLSFTIADITPTERKVIVDLHNKFRTRAQPPASNMLMLRWDNELAMLAQKWANQCRREDDKERDIPGRFKVGQNVGWQTLTFVDAVETWFGEGNYYRYLEGSINDNRVVTHFTQLMWAKTSLIGCGVKTCEHGNLYVCNYAPGGNDPDERKPWKSGTPCADCPGRCVNSKLCDCGRTCLNNGDLNLKDCTCKCKYIQTQQPDCFLNCTETEDYGPCTCTFSAVQCPNRCRICPSAGVGYRETAAGRGTGRETAAGRGTSMPKATLPHLVSLAVLTIIWTNVQHHVVP